MRRSKRPAALLYGLGNAVTGRLNGFRRAEHSICRRGLDSQI
jgi:hypothetical protein